MHSSIQGYGDNFHAYLSGITGLYTDIDKKHTVQIELLEYIAYEH